VNCAELEVVLCDYADGVLGPAERQAVETHLSACAACAELLRDMQAAVAFLQRVESPEPPAELLTRILYHAPISGVMEQPATAQPAGGFFQWFRGFFLQPRFVMGMAMTMLSFSMVARITGVTQRPLTMEDLEPARVWMAVEDKLHRTWDRAVKYYENLRLVYEIEARLQQWSKEEETERRLQSGGPLEPVRQTGAATELTVPDSPRPDSTTQDSSKQDPQRDRKTDQEKQNRSARPEQQE
jgi:hypothetical protein